MKEIQVLDCTLRDGGYCNQWNFGYRNIVKIINGLNEANIDIIEFGFLSNKYPYDMDKTRFDNIKQLAGLVEGLFDKRRKVVMINYGEYDIDDIPFCDGKLVDGIRVAFHKKDVVGALKFCTAIKKKGYMVFVQPMVSISYTDEEFLELIYEVNKFAPYAFYIVDSFGMMKQKELKHLFHLVEENLSKDVWIGFHSHNNLQLAYSNAQSLVDLNMEHNLIIDTCVYGMGRGAGNLNTELFVNYLNDNKDAHYVLKPLLNIIDRILNDFYQKKYWGYSLPNYLSATYNTHPNYANYLNEKNTLTFEAMDEIFAWMDTEKRVEYDETYIEKLYVKYMTKDRVQEGRKAELVDLIKNKKILLIAPGQSVEREKEVIVEFASDKDVMVVNINFDYQYVCADYIFVSNLRRFRELEKNLWGKCIVTSNIATNEVFLKTSYNNLLNDEDMVKDNAGMMAVKFFVDLGVKELYLAGFDGYSHDMQANYAEEQLSIISNVVSLDKMNDGITKVLNGYKKIIEIYNLTKPRFVKLTDDNNE